jgi:acyl-coenzyme A synthetase/AMP-(fatty) acid ligase
MFCSPFESAGDLPSTQLPGRNGIPPAASTMIRDVGTICPHHQKPMSFAASTVPDAARMVIFEPASRWPDATALVFLYAASERTLTYAQVAHQVRTLSAAFVEQGVRRADRVALRLPHSPEFVVAFFAIIAAGAVPVATSPVLTESEFQWIVADSGARWIAGAPQMRPSESPTDAYEVMLDTVAGALETARPDPAARASLEPEPTGDEPAWMVYTSGTSGRPRGVIHAHRALLAREWMRDGWTGLQTADRLLHAGQLNWSYTMGCAVMDTWRVGATGVLVGFQPEPHQWPQLIRRARATVFAAVPSLYRRILKYAPDGSLGNLPLRHALTAGEALAASLSEAWMNATAVPLYEALGMTECSTYLSSGPATPVRAGSAGRPQAGRRVILLPIDAGTDPVDPYELGVIAIHRSDPGLMLGYHNRAAEEAAMMRGEWFITGDLAVRDDDGYFFTLGRNDDLMNASGYRVSPVEVEDVLRSHPVVADVGVTDVDVGDGVKIICAFVVQVEGTTAGADELATELLAHAARALAPWKCPRRIVFTHALPRNANGKLVRRALAMPDVFSSDG